jgi:23S rRNA (guanosine2251-2'-O)-methyltransferase
MENHSKKMAFGFHAVEALLKNSPYEITECYFLKGRNDKRLQKLHSIAEKNQLPISLLDRNGMDNLVAGNHQGVIVTLSVKTEVYDEAYLKSQLKKRLANSHELAEIQTQKENIEKTVPFILVLDGVTDPHNLGACLRSAEAAGVQFVIVPKDNAASLNATAIKVACGAAEAVPLVRVTNLSRTLDWLKQQGVWVMGAAGEAEHCHFDVDMTGPLALVMGSEGKGLRRLTRESCDVLIRIPMLGAVSSLNVSVASGICLFEAVRQKQIRANKK